MSEKKHNISTVTFKNVDIEKVNTFLEKSDNVKANGNPYIIQGGMLSSLTTCDKVSMYISWETNFSELCEETVWQDEEMKNSALLFWFHDFKAWKKTSKFFGTCDVTMTFKHNSFGEGGRYSEVVNILLSSGVGKDDSDKRQRKINVSVQGAVYCVDNGNEYNHKDHTVFFPENQSDIVSFPIDSNQLGEIRELLKLRTSANSTDGVKFHVEDDVLTATNNSFSLGLMEWMEESSQNIDFSVKSSHIESLPVEKYECKLYPSKGVITLFSEWSDTKVSIPLGKRLDAQLDSLKNKSFSFAGVLGDDDGEDDFEAGLDF